MILLKFSIKTRVLFGLFFFFGILSVYSFLIEPNYIEDNTLSISDTGIDMKIVFISDFQRNDSNPEFIQKAVDMINSKNPDLVLLGGDYVEYSADELPSIFPLHQLKSKYGVFGVMGNHEYSAFGFAEQIGGDTELAEQIIEFLENPENSSHIVSKNNHDFESIQILRNEKIILNDNITIIGLDDYWAHLRDEDKIHSEIESKGYRILLSHNQEGLEITKDTADLYLFGHTHCGQIRLPILGSVPKLFGFSGEYDKGHFLLDDDIQVYTTCGLAPAPRLLNPPEIVTINLTA